VWGEGNTIRIKIRLFGLADVWRDDVIEAMSLALADGIGLWENGRILRPWPLLDWHWLRLETCRSRAWTGSAVVMLSSPFKPGASEVFSGDFVTSIRSLEIKLCGLARWSSIDVRRSQDRTAKLVEMLGANFLSQDTIFDGFIKRAKIGDSLVFGLTGGFELRNIDEYLWPILVLGQDVGIGGHRAYGFGQYIII
jgi:hypothetical protein